MPIKLSSVTHDVKKASFVVKMGDDEEKVDFAYKPNAYTPRLEKARQTIVEGNLVGDILISMLVEVLDWVDITDDAGVRIPITEDGLSIVPLRVLSDLMTAINNDMNPGKPKNDDSGGSFSA